jgi:hypothetical protein
MKKFWNQFYKSKVGLYVMNTLLLIIVWKLISFEFTVVLALGFIIGEIDYHYINHK